jgi:DNA-binding NarL/FixJ family response regulator
MLENAGYAVLGPAHTSAEALELARSKRPDVALIDIDLEIPEAGIGLARQLHDLPRIVASAASRPRHFSRSSATPSRAASFTGLPAHNGSGA